MPCPDFALQLQQASVSFGHGGQVGRILLGSVKADSVADPCPDLPMQLQQASVSLGHGVRVGRNLLGLTGSASVVCCGACQDCLRGCSNGSFPLDVGSKWEVGRILLSSGLIPTGSIGADSVRHDTSVHAITGVGRLLSSSRNCCIDGNETEGHQQCALPNARDEAMGTFDRGGNASGWMGGSVSWW